MPPPDTPPQPSSFAIGDTRPVQPQPSDEPMVTETAQSPQRATESRRDASDFSLGNLLRIAGIGTLASSLIAAVVSIATVLTAWSTEKSRLDAADKDRERQAAVAMREQENQQRLKERERRDINDAKLRELQTRYVDLALGTQLCLDYRVRVFGYLSAVLTASEKNWAASELERALERRKRIDGLEKQLDEAQGLSLTEVTSAAIEQFKASGAVAENATNLLAVFRRTNEEQIKALKLQLATAKAADPPCPEVRPTSPK